METQAVENEGEEMSNIILGPNTGPKPIPYEPTHGFPVPLDMTDIFRYEALIDEVTRINNITAPFYMQEFLKAINVASSYYSKSVYEYEQAKTSSKAIAGRLALDFAPSALIAKGLKVTQDNVAAYVESNQEYLNAKDKEAYYKALTEFLHQKFQKFERSHDDARAIFNSYKNQQSNAISGMSSGKDT